MGSQNLRQPVRPETPEEGLITWTILGTWVFWLGGLLYVVGAALAYILLLMAAARVLGLDAPSRRVRAPPPAVIAWIAGMLAMAVALVIAHIDADLGVFVLVKSFIGWMKGWALLAVYPLAGAMLSIRPEIISRATGLLALQTLVLVPLFLMAPVLGLPKDLYVSPLNELIGTGKEFFEVSLFSMDDSTGRARFRFFAPWSTAAAFAAGLGLVLALHERRIAWRVTGIAATFIVCWMSGSRLSVVALPLTMILVFSLANLTRPSLWVAIAAAATLSILMLDDVVYAYQDANEAFNAARAASSRVRTALGNIAVHRWWTEAPIFGHGILDPGGHVVERMLIGSHHTWWGLLFVKGAVGFLGLAVPLGWSFIELIAKAQRDRVARVGLGILISIALFSLGDNIEIVAYLIWPSLVFLGVAFRRRLVHPTAGLLSAR